MLSETSMRTTRRRGLVSTNASASVDVQSKENKKLTNDIGYTKNISTSPTERVPHRNIRTKRKITTSNENERPQDMYNISERNLGNTAETCDLAAIKTMSKDYIGDTEPPTEDLASLKTEYCVQNSQISGHVTTVDVIKEVQSPKITAPLATINDSSLNSRSIACYGEFRDEFTLPSKSGATTTKPLSVVIRDKHPLASEEPLKSDGRMVIHNLILTNFKSYAGTRIVGPFHASFTSVVGPNGSGKSNVIDSLLFVFGFRASKMRQGKVSALIHNSAKFQDLDFCEVEVHFEEILDKLAGLYEIVPGTTLKISRRAFANNSSKYFINGTESNFTAVTALLRGKGVDLDHKRFLILQGEVESIAQMKPKAATEYDDGLLEYLEDIIGTSKYKSPIEESAAEVEALNEACQEKNSRVSLVEKEKKSLETKKDAALAYVQDENDLAIKQSALYQLYRAECEENIEATQESMSQLQTQLENELELHKGGEQEIARLQAQHTVALADLLFTENIMQRAMADLARMDRDSVKSEEKRKHLLLKMQKTQTAMSSSQNSLNEALASTKRIVDDVQRNTIAVSDLEKRLVVGETELEMIRNSLTGKTDTLSHQIAQRQTSLEPWTQKINAKKSAIAIAESELAMIREKEIVFAKASADVQVKLQQLAESKTQKELALSEQQAEKCLAERQIDDLQAMIEQSRTLEPVARSKLSAARQNVDEARASLFSAQNRGKVLTGLLRLKETGRITGFHGRLGDLGTIDKQYDVAVSTACPALDNLVVDSVEIGQRCIAHLRKNNLGRANFIILDRLNAKDMSSPTVPEHAKRLFDLVKPREIKFLPAFFSVLQNTLVTNDMQQAQRIAYGTTRWRVVTLDGQSIDKSGTMSGGGTRLAKGAMSANIVVETNKQDFEKLEIEQESLERNLSNIQTDRQGNETALSDAEARLPNIVVAVQKLELELRSIEKNEGDARKRQEELSNREPADGPEVTRTHDLMERISKAEVDVEQLIIMKSEIESEIKELQDKIMEVGGIRLRSQKAKVESLKEQLIALAEAMASAEVLQEKLTQQQTKQVASSLLADKQLRDLEEQLTVLEQEISVRAQTFQVARASADEQQVVLDNKKEELTDLKKIITESNSALDKARGTEIEVRNQIEECVKSLAENEKRLKYWHNRLTDLCVRDLSGISVETFESVRFAYTRDELRDFDKSHLTAEIAVLEEKMQKVNVELNVITEYRRRVEESATRNNDLKTAITLRDAAKKRCEDFRKLRLDGFMQGFNIISLRLKEMYQMITMGGNAELELVDSLDPFAEGILFSVMPPKKSWKNISNLSGGEKTLSSLALVFALHHYKPTPLYVMDEIDAALDFRNVSIVASYIKERTKNAQFIVISLRNNMFELASRLVGVYKVNHMTKSVTMENRDFR